MLKNSLNIAIPFAQLLTEKGIQLNLSRSSHLSSLFAAGAPDNPQPRVKAAEFVQSVDAATSCKVGITAYDSFDLALKDELKPLVQSHLQMARAIGQVAKGLTSKVQQYVESMPVEGTLAGFNIVQDDLPALFDIPSVMGTMEDTPKQVNGIRLENLVSGNRDSDAVMTYLLTGKKEQDESIKEAVECFGSMFLSDIWNTLIYPGSGDGVSAMDLLNKPAGERATFFFLGGLVADRLLNDIPKDANGTLKGFQSKAADLRDWAMQSAAVAYDEYQNNIKSNRVALSYRPELKTVIVCGAAYKEWLTRGGSAELVLGSMMGHLRAYTAFDFTNNGEMFLKQWNSHCTFQNSASDSRRATLLRSLWLSAFASDIGDIQNFEEAYRKAHPGHAEKCIEEARQYLDTVGLARLDDGHQVSLYLVAKIRFAYTPAHDILKDIDQVLVSNPDVDVREAALVAAAKYIARYLAGQISVTRTK